tara:strand:+ start:97 stop:435 length:339 start_codon:yes stop_codon:yes gene_type:complete
METKDQYNLNNEILCKGYEKLKELFNNDNWSLSINEVNKIVYTSRSNNYEEFEINISDHKIEVSVPMPNSNVLYKTTLYNNKEVIDFIEKHLNNLIISESEEESSIEENIVN